MNVLAALIFMSLGLPFTAHAAKVKAGDSAPLFKAKTQTGADFDLSSRKGKWTVLYFYPKADTPGCTKQACTFRDNIKQITDLGADVFGVSINTVAEQNAFYEKNKLNFTLLADDGSITKLYGAKMPVLGMAKRWTFLIDPELKVRALETNVDPIKDAGRMAELIQQFQK
jgi:thioredoxin-dependent peroxiredoxin